MSRHGAIALPAGGSEEHRGVRYTVWGETRHGVIAGTAATVVMTAFMLVAERAGWMSELPPTRITRRTLDEVSDGPPRGAWLHASAAALHLGVGVGAGVMYATIVGDRPVGRIPPVIRGLAFGTVLWTMA